MKTIIRYLVVGMFLTTVTSVFASVENVAAPLPAQLAGLESAPVIVTHKAPLSAAELAKSRQLEQTSQTRTRQQAAGAGMDTTTMVIIGVIVVVVVVAVASGGGGGMGGGY